MTVPTLSISNDVVYDESFTLDAADNDVASLSFSLPALGTFITPPDGFPQYAELDAASFVDTSGLLARSRTTRSVAGTRP